VREDVGMTDTANVDLSTYNPMDREVQQCPFDHYAALRDAGPLFYHEQTRMYFASRLDIVNEILRDTARFSSRMASAGTAGDSEVMQQVEEIMAEGWPRRNTMLTIDAPHHTKYRKLVSRAFSARRIAALEDKIREVAVELIEAFPEKGSIDFHADFAVSFPVKVIRFALNMAPETEDHIKVWSDAAVAALGASITDGRRLEAAREQVECQQYWFSEYENRLVEPQDDILSDIAHADFDDPDTPEGETRKLEFAEVFSIVQQLMVAGNETTTKFLNETMRMLIENPTFWDQMHNDPEGSWNGLVEEGLRVSSPNQGLFRVVTEDLEFHGHELAKGARVWVMFGAANRDERTFGDAEAFNPGRDNLKEHIAFGKGHHFCIGAPLSRLEGKVAFEELTQRIKMPSFSDSNTFEYEPSFILRGLAQLDLEVEKL
jgi:cytochrome P450